MGGSWTAAPCSVANFDFSRTYKTCQTLQKWEPAEAQQTMTLCPCFLSANAAVRPAIPAPITMIDRLLDGSTGLDGRLSYELMAMIGIRSHTSRRIILLVPKARNILDLEQPIWTSSGGVVVQQRSIDADFADTKFGTSISLYVAIAMRRVYGCNAIL